jgi:phage I-like protein
MFEWFKNRAQKIPPGFYFNTVDITKEDFIKIVPVGNFPNHPNGGHEITPRHIEQMAANFAKTKKDLLFDYEHRSLFGSSRAAGWSSQIEARADGLYIEYPKFTKNAQQQIDDREYRYFSPAYTLNAQDKLSNEIGAILDHVALTNIPYMDNEIDHIKNSMEIDDMKFFKEFLQRLGLAENATEAEVNAKLNSLCQSLGLAEGATIAQIGEKIIALSEPDPDEVKANAAQIHPDFETRLKNLEAKEKDSQKRAAEFLIASAVSDGKILPAHQEIWLNAAFNDFAAIETKIKAMAKNSAMPKTFMTPADKDNNMKVNKMRAAVDYIKISLAASAKRD